MDPRLGRIERFDERSRGWSVSPMLLGPLKSRTWPLDIRLNQELTSKCVGYSRAHDLRAQPSVVKNITEQVAADLYEWARRFDRWEGEDYDGSSVLGGVLAARHLGFVGEFRWAFSLNDLLGAVSLLGGAVIGSVWTEDMFTPDKHGFIQPTGAEAGGHAYFLRGVYFPTNGVIRTVGWGRILSNEPVFRITNSWGPEWGRNGEAMIRASDLQKLLKANGEACIVTKAFTRLV